MFIALGAYLGIEVMATLLSVSPRRSLFGDMARGVGLSTDLALAVIFACGARFLHGAARRRRLFAAVVGPSVLFAVYSLLQFLGLDPLRGHGGARPYSTMGNAIAAGAYLAMVVPLTVHGLVSAGAGRAGKDAVVRRIPLAIALALQVSALVLSKSRGPVLGLLAALAVYGIGWAVLTRRWRLLRLATVAAALAGVALAALLAVAAIAGPRALRHGPLASVARVSSASVRVLIWKGALAAVAESPRRILIGSGPDTLAYVFPPHEPPRLDRLQDEQVTPTRSHNALVDVMVNAGFLGVAGYLVLLVWLVGGALGRVGLVTDGRERAVVGIGAAGFALVCAGAGAVLVGGRLVPVSFGAGGLAGMLAGLVVVGVQRVRVSAAGAPEGAGGKARPLAPAVDAGTPGLGWHRSLVLALVAAMVGHLVEIQVAFGVSATMLLFWIFAGAALAYRAPGADASAPEGGRGDEGDEGDAGDDDDDGAATGPAVAAPGAAAMGVALGALAIAMVWRQGSSLTLGAVVAGAAAAAFVAGAIVGRSSVWVFLSRASVPVVAALALHAFIAPPQRGPDMAEAATVVVVFELLAVALVAFVTSRAGRGGAPGRGGSSVPLVALCAVAAAFPIAMDLPTMRGDCALHPARTAREQGAVGAAISLMKRAVARDPGNEIFLTDLGQTLAGAARQAKTHETRMRMLADAGKELERAAALAPLDASIRLAVAAQRSELVLATPAGAERAARARDAEAAFAHVAERRPRDPYLLGVWCQAATDWKVASSGPRALELCRRARDLAPRDRTKWVAYFEAVQRFGTAEDVIEAAREGLDRFPCSVAFAAELIGGLTATGKRDEAAELSRQVQGRCTGERIRERLLPALALAEKAPPAGGGSGAAGAAPPPTRSGGQGGASPPPPPDPE